MGDLHCACGIALHVFHMTVKRHRLKHASDHIARIQEHTLNINVLGSCLNLIHVPWLA